MDVQTHKYGLNKHLCVYKDKWSDVTRHHMTFMQLVCNCNDVICRWTLTMRMNINTKCMGTTTTSNMHAILGTNFWKYHFDQEILTMHVINELYDKIWIENFVMTCSEVIDVLVENEGQNLDDQKMVIIGISST
ncbi:hypothetical protein PFNF54_00347 [Plasmodium falciparum NF54]|uniref:Uncharacterized protein n=1 Tax=Plasmodium falciparum (isolate NF54) TaxID=5843 RepID=W7KB14_PLAFO|nr:hypothetical protein PFNF54_00347 [Plasmodium falciparum NF54]